MSAIVTELSALEERVQQIVSVLERMRDENRALTGERDDLRAKVRALEAAAGKHAAADYKTRLKSLEEKSGGSGPFVLQMTETTYRNQDGAVVARATGRSIAR